MCDFKLEDKEYIVKFKRHRTIQTGVIVFLVLLQSTWIYAQDLPKEIPKDKIYFSTEEEFITQGPTPPDGNTVISDGDLLTAVGSVYMRNAELVAKFFDTSDEQKFTRFDYGLDAADVIIEQEQVVAFSTELDHPLEKFTEGDLLISTGTVIPNQALLIKFEIPYDTNMGLDAVHFIGEPESIVDFIRQTEGTPRDEWLEKPGMLIEILESFQVDIWISTEGTSPYTQLGFLDGDLLSVVGGSIVISNHDALPPSIPAGIPDRGVDFGMDAFTQALADEQTDRRIMDLFSTEIDEFSMPFTDGEVIQIGNGVIMKNIDLINAFEPVTDNLGLDALAIPVDETSLRQWMNY
jgi:hypothetical protein